jgi:hypothetical protein
MHARPKPFRRSRPAGHLPPRALTILHVIDNFTAKFGRKPGGSVEKIRRHRSNMEQHREYL